uniref:Uncharacterized protein n=1 Tax=Cannabis sativa TaxID=3483 RepID=A0A803QCL8_CANSA
MDLKNLLHSSSNKGKKRTAASETSSDVNVEPLKRSRKTTANKKRASQTIDLETLEVQIQVHTPAIPHVKESVPETHQATTSSSKAPETLPIEATFLSHVAQSRVLHKVKQLEAELCKTIEQREAVAKEWNDAQKEISCLNEEVEETRDSQD